MNVPEVPWRFGERYLATDFVQSQNIAVKEQADTLYKDSKDEFVEAVAGWVRDNFYYPFDNAGNPSAGGQLSRHQKGLMGHHFKKDVYYMWSLPNEVLGATKCGICIDTANLVGSILRAKQTENAWVCLGDIRKTKDDTLLGRHAWVEVPYHELTYVMETTVHEPGVNNLIEAPRVYGKDSAWAKEKGLYYVTQGRYNDNKFMGEGSLGAQIVEVMGLPANRVLLFGIEDTLGYKTSRLHKEWRQEQLLKDRLLREAYKEGRD